MLGPQTRGALGGPDDLQSLQRLLAQLVDESAPFDDVIVAQTPEEITYLVVLLGAWYRGDPDGTDIGVATVDVRDDEEFVTTRSSRRERARPDSPRTRPDSDLQAH